MPVDLGNIKIYMGPKGIGGPDDLEETIVDFINGARECLCFAIHELDSLPIAEAIINARKKGVKVQIILEGDYLNVNEALDDPFIPGGVNEENRRLFSAILRSKIEIISDLNPNIYHQKYIVRDYKSSRAALLTGSTNFTATGTRENLNHIVIVKGKRIADLYLKEFEESWSGTFGGMHERNEGAPETCRASKVAVKVLFSPDHTPELEIMKQILKAKERVDFAIYTFAKRSSGIDDAMIALHRSGIKVRGILDRLQGNQKWAAARPIVDAGAELWWPKRGSGVRKVHHKLVVIDRQVVIAGSFNFTGAANAFNDENIIVIGDMDKASAESKEKQKILAEYVFNELENIIQNYCERIPFPTS